MYARIATFEIPADAPPEVADRVVAEVRRRVTEGGGPIGAQRLMIVMEPGRQRAMNITLFDTEANMDAAESFFEAMHPPDADARGRRGRRTDVGYFRVMLDEPIPAHGSAVH